MISLKFFGAIMVIAGCGGFGFRMAALYIREEKCLREFICVLDFMQCELQYRLTPLPDLCRQAAMQSRGIIREILLQLTRELEDQLSADVEQCVCATVNKVKNIPQSTLDLMGVLGRSLGRYDIEGQLRGLEGVRAEARLTLEQLSRNKDARIRSYQTLGLCTGAAIAIIIV